MDDKIKIMVVDNSSFMRNLICSRLSRAGYATIQTENGESALAALQKDPDIQLITMNVELSGMNGFEIYQQLRHDPFLSASAHNLPVVFITSYDSVEERRKGFDIGAADFVNKAFIDTELVATIDRLCKPDRSMEGLHALVVDDSIFARRIVQRILVSCGVIVTEADNGRKAYELISAAPEAFDMLITDLNMPEMSGVELTRKVRSELKLTDMPILMLSVTEDKVTQIEMFRAGISDYLTKPFIKEELLGRLHAHLEAVIANKKLREHLDRLKQRQAPATDSGSGSGPGRTELLHLLCHDLALPVAAVVNSLEMVESSPELFDTLKEDLRRAAQYSRDLIATVRRSRDTADGSLRLEAVPVDLGSALQESAVLLQRRCDDKGISLKIDLDADHHVMADEAVLVNSVFNNILSNAIKFSHPGDTVSVTSIDSAEYIDVVFRDRGIGIPAELLDGLFSDRTALRPGTSGEEGIGGGLALVRQCVEAFGGELTVVSSDESGSPDDHGTTVTVRLRSA